MNLQIPWAEKYRPVKFSELKGHQIAVQKVRMFLNGFSKKGRGKKCLILHGPPGTGKTTLAYVAANEAGAEILELNASDLRDKNKLREILKPAMEQKSLVKQNKIILIDEVDGISKVDWGGLPELLVLAEGSSYPLFITANDIWDKRFSALRRKSEVVQLKEIDSISIKERLLEIAKKEGSQIDDKIITKISLKSRGDLRAAINDLQTASNVGAEIVFDDRNKEVDIFHALKLIFKGKPTQEVLRIFDSVNIPLDKIFLWIEENIPEEYSGEELERAYNFLSKADIFKGRIYKQQYWRFLVYENIFLSYGISCAKNPDAVKTGFTNYKKPSRILKIWLHNQKTAKKKSIAQKYAKFVHVGVKRALNEFPVMKNILQNPKVQKELKLSQDEIEYLRN